jgi:hypothetical protein
MRRRGEDPETLAGLVTVLRCCGLLEASIAAHTRALALDSTFQTSVAHTYFLRGEYPLMFETYYPGGTHYLDAAAWAGLGDASRAASLLRTRLAQRPPGFMSNLMASLLAVLDGQREQALQIMGNLDGLREPEGLFYFARHLAMLNIPAKTVEMISRACRAGFWCSYCLERDPVFAKLRERPEFVSEVQCGKRLELQAAQDVREALGRDLAAVLLPPLSTLKLESVS